MKTKKKKIVLIEKTQCSITEVAGMCYMMEETEAIEYIKTTPYTYRVTQRDKKHIICTRDYKVDRINLHIESGRVVDTTIG